MRRAETCLVPMPAACYSLFLLRRPACENFPRCPKPGGACHRRTVFADRRAVLLCRGSETRGGRNAPRCGADEAVHGHDIYRSVIAGSACQDTVRDGAWLYGYLACVADWLDDCDGIVGVLLSAAFYIGLKFNLLSMEKRTLDTSFYMM